MELPKGWVESSIAKIAYVLQGYVFPKDRQGKSSGKYPVYKVGDISNSLQQGDVYLTSSKNYIDDDDLLNLKAKLLPAKTVGSLLTYFQYLSFSLMERSLLEIYLLILL